jgi:hypothetical protein
VTAHSMRDSLRAKVSGILSGLLLLCGMGAAFGSSDAYRKPEMVLKLRSGPRLFDAAAVVEIKFEAFRGRFY